MTDKIIIDGTDVNECKFYHNDNGIVAPDGTAERTEICFLTNDYCGNYINCYYKQLKQKEQECDKYRQELANLNEIIDRFLITSGKSKDIALPEELEEVFEDIERIYSEHEELQQENGELKAENFAFEGLVKAQDNLLDDLQNKNDSIQNIVDDLQRRNHDLTQMLETKEKELEKLKEKEQECEKLKTQLKQE